jgi:hypothetical protein
MLAIARPFFSFLRPRAPVLGAWMSETRRRKHTTIDLIHASHHLRRDIGLLDEHISVRRP